MASTLTRGTKRQRTTGASDEYELIYWPGIPGRGEFVRLLFEATGTAYKDLGNMPESEGGGVKNMISLIIPGSEPDSAAADENNPPPMAPPILRHGSFLLSQLPSILLYLGPRLGLVPQQEEDPEGLYHINTLALTALDGFSNEAHDTHHPIATSKVYEDQKDEAKKRAGEYITMRLPKFLGHFERVLGGASSAGGEWLYAGRMSYADLVLFQGIDGCAHAFPNAIKNLRASGKYEKVFALYERVKTHDKIAAYLGSNRRLPYGNGIWRHYPELDEQ